MILSVEVRNGSLSAEMKAILTNQEVRRTETLTRIYSPENVLTIKCAVFAFGRDEQIGIGDQ